MVLAQYPGKIETQPKAVVLGGIQVEQSADTITIIKPQESPEQALDDLCSSLGIDYEQAKSKADRIQAFYADDKRGEMRTEKFPMNYIQTNASLEDIQSRYDEAEKLLGITLNEEQRLAIQEAHMLGGSDKEIFDGNPKIGASKLRRLLKDGVFTLDQAMDLCDAGICGKRFGAKLFLGLALVYIGSAATYDYLEYALFDKSQLSPIIKAGFMELIYGGVLGTSGLLIANSRLGSIGGLRIGDVRRDILDKGNSMLRVGGMFVGTHMVAKIEKFMNLYAKYTFDSLLNSDVINMQDAPIVLMIILIILQYNVRKADRAGLESIADPDLRDESRP